MSGYAERIGGDTIQRAAGRVVNEEWNAKALKGPRHAGTERCRNETKAAHKQPMRN